jgi:signal transduction histidine kinase
MVIDGGGPGERNGADVLAAVAHELRTSLTALATSSELLAEDLETLDPSEIRGMVAAIRRGAVWIQALVENLLCAAAIREGRFRVQPRPIDLLDVVEDIVPIVGPLLAQRGQRLRSSQRGALPHVAADARRVGQVLVNLISNAAKFSAPGTPIDIGLTGRAGWLRVSVSDCGPGLPPGGRARLFEPFERGEAAERGGPEGVGLGLAIVASIVEAHSGRVGAENRPGGGARFWFELPVVPAHPARERTEQAGRACRAPVSRVGPGRPRALAGASGRR